MRSQTKKVAIPKGALLFKLWRIKHNFTQTAIARELGISPPAVSHWENFKTLPDSQHMLLLEKKAHIPFQSWFE